MYKASPRTKTSTDPRYRVFRGGGWRNRGAAGFRAALRSGFAPAIRSGSVGFRCVQRGCRQQILKDTP